MWDYGSWRARGVDRLVAAAQRKESPSGQPHRRFFPASYQSDRATRRAHCRKRGLSSLCYVVDLCLVRMVSVLSWRVDIWNFPLGPGFQRGNELPSPHGRPGRERGQVLLELERGEGAG